MILSTSLRSGLWCLFCITCLFFGVITAAGDDWRPVSPEELALKAPKVEADADAEAIFWEVRVDDSSESLVMNHYIRVKIFTERGREKYSKIDIPYLQGMKIKNIKARIIKPDGSISELTKNDIFEREIVKADKIKVKAKSFAVPNIESGVIVEYRYQETYPIYSSANNMRMIFQHDIPVENISYYFRPADNARYLTFNMKENKFIKDKGGYYRATMENVPATKVEPQMPPEDEVRSWLVLYYTDDLKGNTSDFWARAGGYLAYSWEIKDTLKPGKDLKEAINQITAGAVSPDEKLAKIFSFCKRLKNITYDTQLTDEQKDDIKPNKSTTDTYRKLQGTSVDINELFASLATAAGFEARLAFGGDRSQKFFNPNEAHVSFIHFSSIAVKVDEQWKYFDPGSLYTSSGMLPWYEENTSVLLLGYKDYILAKTPLSEAAKSSAKRTGKFKLLEDGTLEGTVRIEYSGHLSSKFKLDNYEDSLNKREESLKDSVKEQISAADITNIKIENIDDPEKPFVYSYSVRVPNYAQKTGKRIFLQPGYFEYGVSPVFSTAARTYDIYFQYPWSENDDIEIELPKGFSLDNPDVPKDIVEPTNIGSLSINVGIERADNKLIYSRKFFFGGRGKILFPRAAYEPLKNLFDAFQKADAHTITLKQN